MASEKFCKHCGIHGILEGHECDGVTIERLTDQLCAEREAAEMMMPLLREAIAAHADPESHDYNECDKPEERCMFCAKATEAIVAYEAARGGK